MPRFKGGPSGVGGLDIADPRSVATTLLSMGKDHQGKLGSLIQTAILGQSIYGQAKGLYDGWKERREHVISIGSYDPLYGDIQRWIMSLMDAKDKRYLTVSSTRRYGRNHPLYSMDDDAGVPSVNYFYDGSIGSHVFVSGHRIEVSVEAAMTDDQTSFRREGEKRLVLRMHSVEARNTVIATIDRLSVTREIPEQPSVMMASQYGNWEPAHSLQPRDPRTVVLREGQFERLDDDLRRFLASEKQYARVGMPWHRGYLLHGAPGCGKTSCALALANVHKLDVYYLSLTDIKTDVDILKLFADIPNRSMLLMEDIDISSASGPERADTGKLTADGLLNALDGVMTPSGLVVIMTTNFIDRLDPALTRPGRCDIIEKIDVLTTDQAEALALAMTGRMVSLPPVERLAITAADLTELVKRNIFDMDAAADEIRAYVYERELSSVNGVVA